MDKSRKVVLTNFLYNYFYQILLIIIPLITTPYITRAFSMDSLGRYTYFYTIAGYFVLIGLLGINNYGNRTIAMVKNEKVLINKTFSEIFTIQLIASVLSLFIYLSFLLFVNPTDRIYVLVTSIYVLSSCFDLNWFLFGLENFKFTVTKNVIIKVATSACIFLFIKDQDDFILYTLLMCGSTVIGNISVMPYIFKHFRYKFPKLSDLKVHIKPILVLFIPVIAVSIYKYMDKIMLGNMIDMTEVTMYEYAEKINSVPHGIVAALGTVMLPRTSSLIKEGKADVASKMLNMTMVGIAILTPAISFGLASISPELAPLFLGSGYGRCGVVIQYIAFMLIFISANNVIRTQALIPYKKDISYILALCCGAVCNLVFNFLFIPRFGAVGAAIGTVVAEFAVFVVQAYCTRELINFRKYFLALGISILLGILMFWVLRYVVEVDNSFVSIVARIIIGIIFYTIPYLSFILLRNRKNRKTRKICRK